MPTLYIHVHVYTAHTHAVHAHVMHATSCNPHHACTCCTRHTMHCMFTSDLTATFQLLLLGLGNLSVKHQYYNRNWQNVANN
jgi:hypothetical protein